MSSYQNRLQSYSGSIGENEGQLNNYLAKKGAVAVENRDTIVKAKSALQAHLTGEFIKGAGFEGAIRTGKPMLGKGLSWLDKKTGFSKAVDKKAGISDFKPDSKSGVENVGDDAKPSGLDGLEGEDIPTTRTTSLFRQNNNVLGNMKEDYQGNQESGESKSSGESKTQDGGDGDMEMSDRGSGAGETKTPDKGINSGEETGKNKLGVDEDDSISAEPAEAADIPDVVTAGADDAVTTAATEGGDAAATTALETAGTALDATGVGAIVGIPLQLAGIALEGAGVYEAGKAVVDWFKEDILGDKTKVNPVLQKAPPVVSTLAGIGAQATPTFDSTMDAPRGIGSW